MGREHVARRRIYYKKARSAVIRVYIVYRGITMHSSQITPSASTKIRGLLYTLTLHDYDMNYGSGKDNGTGNYIGNGNSNGNGNGNGNDNSNDNGKGNHNENSDGNGTVAAIIPLERSIG